MIALVEERHAQVGIGPLCGALGLLSAHLEGHLVIG
jgi:hypothetical protein